MINYFYCNYFPRNFMSTIIILHNVPYINCFLRTLPAGSQIMFTTVIVCGSMQTRWIVLGITYNWRETRHKRPLGRDPDRSWYHYHTSIKLFWLHPMASWTYELCCCRCRRNHGLWPKTFTLVFRWHQPCPGPYPMAACPKFHIGCRLSQNISPCSRISPMLIW